MIEDSSGNAGASLAAHGAKFGIRTEFMFPKTLQDSKSPAPIYGVDRTVSGKDTERAAHGRGEAPMPHAYHPAYLSGQMTAVFEVWEQLEGKTPD